jgi:hypothetical protein
VCEREGGKAYDWPSGAETKKPRVKNKEHWFDSWYISYFEEEEGAYIENMRDERVGMVTL